MSEVLIQPLLAGLSTGLFCVATCVPFLAPYLASERRGMAATVRVLGQFLLGRLAGYVLFGAVFGWLGERANFALFNAVSSGALILLSALIAAYALGLLRPGWSWCAAEAAPGARAPFLMGVLLGVNVCPPFLLSLAYVFTLHSAAKGILYFLVFFAATSVYFLPLGFLGPLGRIAEVRGVARLSALAVGVLFAIYGVFALTRGAIVIHGP
jgi:sulfite exporter TauE/SafE